MKKVIAAGHICLDITPVFPDMEGTVSDWLVPGKLIQMKGVDVHTGGSAANTGLALKKLGMDVRIMGKVGRDDFGEIIKSILEKHGVREGLIVDEHSPTSYSVVLAMPGIDRIFLHDPGANDTYCGEDLPDQALEGADLFHFGYPPLMRRMYQDGGKELAGILRHVQEMGIPVSLDMAAADPQSEAGKAPWREILMKALPFVDIFVPSIEELLFMMNREKYEEILGKAAGRDVTEVLDLPGDAQDLGEELLSMGVGIVLIKCGKAGLYLATAQRDALSGLESRLDFDADSWAGKRIFEKCYRPEKVCSAAGAGDTCIAAFLTALLSGRDPEKAIKLAAGEGASCVEAYDALSGLRTLEELEEKILSGWEKA